MPEEVDIQGQVANMLGTDTEQQIPESVGSSEPPVAPQEPASQPVTNPFLAEIAEEHREIVAPYLQKWDANATRKFQELHSQLKPYQQLGDPQVLTQAQQLYNLLNTNPEAVYRVLAEQFGQQGSTELDDDDPFGEPNQVQGLPPEYIERLEKQEQMLQAVSQILLEERQAKQRQQEDQEVEQYFNLLHQEFGDFDDEFVIGKILAGAEPEAAVKAYQAMIQEQVNRATQALQNAPELLSGGGTVPSEQQNIGKAGRKDVRSLVESLLTSGQGE